MSNYFYLPAFVIIAMGSCLILFTTIDGLVIKTANLDNQIIYQAVGAALLATGLVILMTVAVYTYKREDIVREECGYPSLYEAARTQAPSMKDLEESMTFTSNFVERSSSRGRLSRKTSFESKASFSNLGWSFSSNSTAMSWLQKHKKEQVRVTKPPIRRQNSDSALETRFARNRILSWRTQVSTLETEQERDNDECETSDNVERNNNVNREKLNVEAAETNNVYSSVSTTSSGYDSAISSPSHQQHQEVTLSVCASTYSRHQNLARSISDSYGDYTAKFTLPMAGDLAGNKKDFNDTPPSVPLLPTIKVFGIDT